MPWHASCHLGHLHDSGDRRRRPARLARRHGPRHPHGIRVDSTRSKRSARSAGSLADSWRRSGPTPTGRSPQSSSSLNSMTVPASPMTRCCPSSSCCFWLVQRPHADLTALAGAVLEFARHPEEFQRLLEDATLMPSAVEEVVRYTTPSIYKRRTASRDVELAGVRITQGDKVTVWEMSANHDRRCPRPISVRRWPSAR